MEIDKNLAWQMLCPECDKDVWRTRWQEAIATSKCPYCSGKSYLYLAYSDPALGGCPTEKIGE